MADDTFYGSDFGALQSFDPDIAGVLLSELDRIRGGLQLIASENISSPAVLTALEPTLQQVVAAGSDLIDNLGNLSTFPFPQTTIDEAPSSSE